MELKKGRKVGVNVSESVSTLSFVHTFRATIYTNPFKESEIASRQKHVNFHNLAL